MTVFAHPASKSFCHAVLERFDAGLRDAGHTNEIVVLTGMTCSALTAGVMALGLALGEVERSRLRVLRMIGMMAAGGDAFADDVNKFNRVMNRGHELARWFTGAIGSTQCRRIAGCDFSTPEGVNQYIDTDGVARCQMIARQVAAEVERTIDSTVPTMPSATHQTSPR